MTCSELVRMLMTMPPGWTSIAEVTMTLWPDPTERRAARQLIGELARSEQIPSMYVRHNRQPMLCIFLDSLTLSELVAS